MEPRIKMYWNRPSYCHRTCVALSYWWPKGSELGVGLCPKYKMSFEVPRSWHGLVVIQRNTHTLDLASHATRQRVCSTDCCGSSSALIAHTHTHYHSHKFSTSDQGFNRWYHLSHVIRLSHVVATSSPRADMTWQPKEWRAWLLYRSSDWGPKERTLYVYLSSYYSLLHMRASTGKQHIPLYMPHKCLNLIHVCASSRE